MSILCCIVILGACSSQPAIEPIKKDLSDIVLEKIGLQKLSTAKISSESIKPYSIDLSVQAGDNLNAGNTRQPLSVVMKIYQLRSATAFQQLTIEQAQSPDQTTQALGDSVINVREVVLIPGQQLSIQEVVPRDGTLLGFTTLFHSPAQRRWKFAFDTATAVSSGITIGIHACAMTVSRGEPLDDNGWHNDALLARTRCEEH